MFVDLVDDEDVALCGEVPGRFGWRAVVAVVVAIGFSAFVFVWPLQAVALCRFFRRVAVPVLEVVVVVSIRFLPFQWNRGFYSFNQQEVYQSTRAEMLKLKKLYYIFDFMINYFREPYSLLLQTEL